MNKEMKAQPEWRFIPPGWPYLFGVGAVLGGAGGLVSSAGPLTAAIGGALFVGVLGLAFSLMWSVGSGRALSSDAV